MFGKHAKQLKEIYGLGKSDNLRNRFNASDLSRVKKIEGQISSLIDLDYDYQIIKDIVLKKYVNIA